MENIDKNADVLTILDGLQDYAAEYEARKKKQEEEEKKNKEEAERAKAQADKKRKVEDEIAEILGKIKSQEVADAKRFEEERLVKEAKKAKEDEMKAKIAEQLAKMQQFEEEQHAKIAQEQQRRADEKLQKLMKEAEEQKKKEVWERNRLAEKKKAQEAEIQAAKMKREVAEELAKIHKLEEIQQANIMKELQTREDRAIEQLIKDREEQKKEDEKEALDKRIKEAKKKKVMMEEMNITLRKEEAKRKAKDEETRKQRIDEEEKIRQSKIEEEKKRLEAEEYARQQLIVEEEARKRKEDDQRISLEIMARRQAEEEEIKRMKKEADEMRLKAVEDAKVKALEDKKKAFEKKVEEKPVDMMDRPKRKSVSNPFAKKFEDIATNAMNEEKLQQEMMRKKKRDVKKTKDLLRRSKQILHKASKESIRKSQGLFKKKSSDSLKGENFLQKSFSNLRRSLSKECIGKSKSHLYDKERNLSSKNLSVTKSGDNTSASRQTMQNYLVSQVLFDGKEDVRTSRMQLQSKANAILEEAEDIRSKKLKEEENKQKELAMIKRENEMRKQVAEELIRIKNIEEEQRIKHEEAQFEAYKKEMEKYLNFVCEDEDSKPKKTKRKSISKAAVEEPSKKLVLNIGNLKSQFEEGDTSQNESPKIKSAPVNVKKLNPIKLFNEKKEEEKKPRNKKEYVPVIIDKAAFERTVGMFEKEKRQEEDNKQRIQKRRAAMEEEKERLLVEKERHLAEEKERQRQKDRIEKEIKDMYEEEQKRKKAREIEEQNKKPAPEPEPVKLDIFEQIKNTLAQVKADEEVQRIRIEKDRKKKELKDQIQQEISKIQSFDSSLKETDEEDTPAWIKLVMGNKSKPEPPKVEKKEAKRIDRSIVVEQIPDEKEDVFAPKWITMFQERNKKIQAQQAKTEEQEKMNRFVKEQNRAIALNKAELLKQSVSVEDEKESTNNEEDLKDISLKKSKTTGTLDLMSFEPQKKKSVSEMKTLLENSKKEENIKVEKRTGTQKVADKVKRVKSLLMESGKPEKKISDQKVTKQKATHIKSMFETKSSTNNDNLIEVPKRPKKKLVKPTIVDASEQKSTKKEEHVWKWKEKSVSELYEFINHNRKHLPETLATKADKTFSEEPRQADMELNVDEFDEYISNVHNYINQEDEDETESVFKDTIVAYLDLIDENPRKKNKQKSLPKKIFSVNTAAVKNLLEGNRETETEKREINIGKVDTSFLFKEQDLTKSAEQNHTITHDNTNTIKSMYEELWMVEEPKELYSMKRKLTVVQPTKVISEPTKKEQAQYQWKYKQKGIEELQKFIIDNKKNIEKEASQQKTSQAYVPMFQLTDVKSRNVDEEKKMEEFERFMEEMHGYLESDTKNEEESTFKWGIHSYIDLIEEDKDTKPTIKYEKKQNRLLPDNVPKMTDIKARLQEQSLKATEDRAEMVVGKVDHSFLQNSDKEDGRARRASVEVASVGTSKMRAQFEEKSESEKFEEKERLVVKKKIVDICSTEEPAEMRKEMTTHQWKYKQKSLAELQEFIKKNKDIAPKALVANTSKTPTIDTAELLAKSNFLKNRIEDKEGEFNEFMDELENFLGKNSNSKMEDDMKAGIQGYLDLIDPEACQQTAALPSLGSVKKIKDIQSSLTSGSKSETKDNAKIIGKVSHFFKKSTNEKVDSSVIRDNIATLLQPGKAKTLGKAFEAKPKLTRANSAIDISVIPKKLSLDQFIKPKKETLQPLPKKRPEQSQQFRTFKAPKLEQSQFEPAGVNKIITQESDKYKNEWDDIEDPIEKQNAILAKYGLKPRNQRTEEEEDEDLEDILNYKCTEDVGRYREELKVRYGLMDDESSEDEAEPINKKGSFSSLLNILNVMKKSTASKNFSESKARAAQFGMESGRLSHSEVDLTDIKGSCSDLKGMFESGRAFQQEALGSTRRQSLDLEGGEAKLDTAGKRAQWEKHFMGGGGGGGKKQGIEEAANESVRDVKAMFEKGELNQETIREYFNQRSETTGGDKSQVYSRVKAALAEEEPLTEREERERELEELREAGRAGGRFRLENGAVGGGLRRAASCSGVSGERVMEELDGDTMKEVSMTQKMVKAMFEQQTAPKYKFGGSGSNLSLNSSKEDVSKPVMRKVAKPKDERKWVLDSINKYFDVIVEEEEEKEDGSEDEDDDEYSSGEEESDYDYSENEEEMEDEDEEDQGAGQPAASSKMRGLLSSVVTNLSGSVGHLGRQDILSSLKQGLGSRTNLRASNSQLNLARQ